MDSHDQYGKRIMRAAVGARYHDGAACCTDMCCSIDYQTAGGARIDGTVDSRVAVEIESRTSKQVRGAVLDLICHAYPKKLLVLLPVHMSNPCLTAAQCRSILRRFVSERDFQVIVAAGSAKDPKPSEDADLVRCAVEQLLRDD